MSDATRPYVGLQAFRASDASLFFGREREVQELTAPAQCLNGAAHYILIMYPLLTLVRYKCEPFFDRAIKAIVRMSCDGPVIRNTLECFFGD